MIRYKQREGAFSLVGILLTIAIILFLSYLILGIYLRQFPFSKGIKDSLSEQGIEQEKDAPSYKSISDSTRKKIEELIKKRKDILIALG